MTNNPLPDSGSGPSTPTPTGDGGTTTPDAGPRADGVIREIFYHQLTVDNAKHAPSNVPAFARNGSRIAFVVRGEPTRVFTVEADGSNIKQVDQATQKSGTPYPFVAISADGGTIAWSDGIITRIVGADGNLKNHFEYSQAATGSLFLTQNGSDLVFMNGRDEGTGVPRGIYKVPTSPDNTVPTNVLEPLKFAAAIGRPAEDIGNFGSCTYQLGVSQDGSKIVAAARVRTISGAGSDYSSAVVTLSGGTVTKLFGGVLTEGNTFVNQLTMSPDGTLIGYNIAANNPSGSETGVISFDGSKRTKLAEHGIGDGCSAPLTISDDNKQLAQGHTSVVWPIDGSEPWTVIARTGSPTIGGPKGFYLVAEPDSGNSRLMSMSGDGKRFVYPNNDAQNANPAHVVIAEVDENKLGATPPLSEPHVSAPFITAANATKAGSNAGITAKSGTVDVFVGAQLFLKGQPESSTARGDFPLLDDGTHNDGTAGDGLYGTGDALAGYQNATFGPRTLRVKVEAKDYTTGKRSAHAFDFGPFEIKSQ